MRRSCASISLHWSISCSLREKAEVATHVLQIPTWAKVHRAIVGAVCIGIRRTRAKDADASVVYFVLRFAENVERLCGYTRHRLVNGNTGVRKVLALPKSDWFETRQS